MKQKILVGGLCLSLALSLVSCGGRQTGQEPQEPGQEVNQTEPVTTEPITPSAQPEQLSDKEELEEISHDELIEIFKENYEISKSLFNSDEEEIIRSELEMIKTVVKSADKELPSDYEMQYRTWRPSVAQQAQEVTLTFTNVNETVYATGTVNLRSGPSTNDEKVGALNKGQSVTRTGIGTGDYSSWSRVKLSDGSEVYVASSYLSTTKPSSGSSSQQGGGKTQTPSSGQQGQQQGGSSEDRGTSGPPSYTQEITDPSQIATGIKDPYNDPTKIGYGG